MAIKEHVVSLLSVGIDLDGNLVLDHGISVFGVVRGTIISSIGLLHIGETGRVTGNLDGEHVRVDGTVQGDIRARESIEVNGRVDGTIFYSGTIRLGPHAVIDGQLKRVGRDVLVNPPEAALEPSNVASLAAVRS